MKYRITNIRFEYKWKAELHYWEGCYCSHKIYELEMDEKPTLRSAVKLFVNS